MKIQELFEAPATMKDFSTVSIEDMGDGKFLVSVKEKKGPMLNVMAGIVFEFYRKKGVDIKTKVGLPAEPRRIAQSKIGSWIFTFKNPEGAKEKLEKVAEQKLASIRKEVAGRIKSKEEAPQRKKEMAAVYSKEAKERNEKLDKMYGKGTRARVKYFKHGGDDAYSYALSRDGKIIYTGLNLNSARHDAEMEMLRLAKRELLGEYSPE